MKRKFVAMFALAVTLLGLGASPAFADTVSPSPAFGQHVSSMSPEHPLELGSLFGECVSTMATTGSCAHA